MNLVLRETSANCIEMIRSLPMVKSCESYGSIANNTEDDLSDIDIRVDVSGYDNGRFMLEVPHLLEEKMNIIYSDFAPSLAPRQYIVSLAVSEENPFAVIDINCVAEPHCATVFKEQMENDLFSHTLKVWVANLKHYIRGTDCRDDIIRMAKRLHIRHIQMKSETELLEETLRLLEDMQTDRFYKYVSSCRKKFEELVL